ncbi:hypothetical protein EDD21DRAFT_135178 [Dissophora ornata]|nr:hypothetical protein BGZ58_008025 [Dissophora ornata]KAI8600370.1 hypothetical protein EDD21DRAFT_135178 [Dissophora ornata]
MRSTFTVNLAAFAVVSAISVVSAYQCPDSSAITTACGKINVSPLTCSDPNINKDECNAKQCNQSYIDNYAACQCSDDATAFYEHSVNVEGLIRRCSINGLVNPFGNSIQYRAGQGTAAFETASSTSATSTAATTTTTASPDESDNHVSGGAIAGIVLGCVGAVAIAGFLAWCWRRNRNQHGGSVTPLHKHRFSRHDDPEETAYEKDALRAASSAEGTGQMPIHNLAVPIGHATTHSSTRGVYHLTTANSNYTNVTAQTEGSGTGSTSASGQLMTSYNPDSRSDYIADNGYSTNDSINSGLANNAVM